MTLFHLVSAVFGACWALHSTVALFRSGDWLLGGFVFGVLLVFFSVGCFSVSLSVSREIGVFRGRSRILGECLSWVWIMFLFSLGILGSGLASDVWRCVCR